MREESRNPDPLPQPSLGFSPQVCYNVPIASWTEWPLLSQSKRQTEGGGGSERIKASLLLENGLWGEDGSASNASDQKEEDTSLVPLSAPAM